MTLARVLLAEDHRAVAEQLHALLQTEFDVVAVVGDGHALLGAVQSLRPDVVVSDIAMPGLDGLAAATRILGQNHAARIVLVSIHDEPALVQAAVDAGVLGYVCKSKAGEELLPAVHAAMRGERHVPASSAPDG
jgi:DNA-binding NarL/FixJ family response regulator